MHPARLEMLEKMRWHADRFNGERERGHGVRVEVPGNSVGSLRTDTNGMAAPPTCVRRRTEPDHDTDRLHDRVENGTVRGYGGSSKLDAILSLFRDLVGRGRS